MPHESNQCYCVMEPIALPHSLRENNKKKINFAEASAGHSTSTVNERMWEISNEKLSTISQWHLNWKRNELTWRRRRWRWQHSEFIVRLSSVRHANVARAHLSLNYEFIIIIEMQLIFIPLYLALSLVVYSFAQYKPVKHCRCQRWRRQSAATIHWISK